MKRRGLLSSLAGSLILAAAAAPAAMAQSATDVANNWWVWHGDIEVAGRFFVNNPQRNGIAALGGDALGKYYEYSDIRPGPFGYVWLNTGSKDRLWNVDVWADNIGYNDQRYQAEISKAGEFYLDIGWDQVPHIYSTNALTLYNGIGTTTLTLPPGLSNLLFGDVGCTRVVGKPPTGCNAPGAAVPTPAQRAQLLTDLANNLHQTDIGIRRDTASVEFRWTPSTAWDIHLDYSNMHRYGTQVEGVVFAPGTSGVTVQAAKPVDDRTQNFGLNGEYQGTSPWGQLVTLKLGYAGSIYDNALNSYTVENPFCGTGSGPGECARGGIPNLNSPSPSSPLAMMSLWPDNQAHGFTSTLGADLPMKSRYMGTISYTMMRQNQAFLPFTNQATVYNGTTANPYLTQGAPPVLPASSLNGAINTFLSNNVLTTQITPELKSKLSYRYYNFDNATPELFFPDWVVTDVKLASSTSANYTNVRSLSMAYTKQNGDADLNWRPSREWNMGAAYLYEGYDWTRTDVGATHEHGLKTYLDWKPWIWLTMRTNWMFSDRRFSGNYDYLNNVGFIQWSSAPCLTGACSVLSSTAMRQFYLDNRDRNKGQFSIAIDVLHGLTVTPTFGYQDDNYKLAGTELGLTRSQMVRAGVEVAYLFNPSTTFLFSYMNEHYRQDLRYTTATGTTPLTAATTFNADVRDTVNTFIGAVNWAAIPDKLDLRASYSLSLSKDSQPQVSNTGAVPVPQYADMKGQWTRFELLAKYTFDKDTLRAMGWAGGAYAKLRYVWERNSVDNFDQDIMQAYMSPLVNTTGYMTWMAYDNPNYSVHLIGASLGFTW